MEQRKTHESMMRAFREARRDRRSESDHVRDQVVAKLMGELEAKPLVVGGQGRGAGEIVEAAILTFGLAALGVAIAFICWLAVGGAA